MKKTKQEKEVDIAIATARKLAIQNAIAHNNCLTREYLEVKPNKELLAFMHPLDRMRLKDILDPPLRSSYN